MTSHKPRPRGACCSCHALLPCWCTRAYSQMRVMFEPRLLNSAMLCRVLAAELLSKHRMVMLRGGRVSSDLPRSFGGATWTQHA
jgi:hypothetical protein